MKMRVGARTDVGLVRERNEDGYLARGPLFAVADGMGGHLGGEVASKVALETLARMKPAGDDIPAQLEDTVRKANRAVLDRAGEDPRLQGMGTTLTTVVAAPDRIHLAHVGDSRAYLLRDGRLQQLTEDQTVVQKMVNEGRLTREEADIHPQRSILTQALGAEGDLDVEGNSVPVHPGDRLLLCSDGLTSMVREADIERILQDSPHPQKASDALVEAARAAGGQDNITAVVVDFANGEAAATTRAPARAAPAEARRPRGRRRRILGWSLAILIVLGGLLAGGKVYVDRQWFVGVSDDRVTLYRGIPARPLGLDLATVVEQTDIPASEAEQLEPWRQLESGITASSEDEGRQILAQIRTDVEERRAQEAARQRAQEQKDRGGKP